MLYLNEPINIIMVTYHRINDFKKCIASIISNTTVPYRLHIIDNSQNEIDEALNEYSHFSHINIIKNNQNIGKAKSVNKWYKRIMVKDKTGLFVSIDSDIIVDKNWLCKLVKSYHIINAKSKMGILAPVIKNNQVETWDWQLNNVIRMHNVRGLGDDRLCGGVYYNRYTAGPLFLINKRLFEAVGKFYDKQLYGADDGKLCKAANDAGFFVGIDTKVEVIHSNLGSDEEYDQWKMRNIKGDVDIGGRWDQPISE